MSSDDFDSRAKELADQCCHQDAGHGRVWELPSGVRVASEKSAILFFKHQLLDAMVPHEPSVVRKWPFWKQRLIERLTKAQGATT